MVLRFSGSASDGIALHCRLVPKMHPGESKRVRRAKREGDQGTTRMAGNGDQQLQLYPNWHSFRLQGLPHDRNRRYIPPRPESRWPVPAQGRPAGETGRGRQVCLRLVAAHCFLSQAFQC